MIDVSGQRVQRRGLDHRCDTSSITKPLIHLRAVAQRGRQDPLSAAADSSELRGGAKGTRTPDLLHAMPGRPVARRGQALPGVATACANCGWMWPGVGGCPATLAPNLAPSRLVSRANVRTRAQRSTSPRILRFPSRHSDAAGVDVMPMSRDGSSVTEATSELDPGCRIQL
jgi:hypothetical protein